MSFRRLSIAALLFLPAFAFAQEGDDAPIKGSGGSGTAESALKKFTVAPGLVVDLWASEPMVINPVAFSFDNRGRAFVAETYRRKTSVPDIRANDAWQVENLALLSVADRLAFFKAKYPEATTGGPPKGLSDRNGDGRADWRDLEVESERIKLVVDSNGDGRADQSSVFVDGFNKADTGIGAGVLVHGDSVYYTCVPDLWRFEGAQAGTVTKREALLSGFGNRVVFSGHDMHGLRIGPDGRLYWSNADSGSRVVTKEGTVLDCPDSGAVFRCDLDGRNAEIVAVGLRNPQHLAWNAVGDLFTGDNNADGGDKARWEHIVDGADYGWRIGWQFLRKNGSQPQLGAWNAEGMWRTDVAKTNLSLLPPVALIGHGPAGIAYYPGTGLPDTYRDHFFYADFPGGVRTFRLAQRGASYAVDGPQEGLQDNSASNLTGKLLWGLYPSDVQFGVDGGAYVLDWIQGWEKTGKGRIFRVHDAATDASAPVQETKKLLAEGFDQRPAFELARLLGHADQRVRQGAQFALVAKADLATLASVAGGDGPLLWRLHGLWGLGQLARASMPAKQGLLARLEDRDPEMRAQAARMLGAAGVRPTAPRLIKLLADPAPRVRFFAAQALSKLGEKDAVPALFTLLHENADHDAYIRHAAVVALAALADAKTLADKATDASEFVRAGALLALRRQASPEIARFLTDANPQLVLEAARGIHDGAIPAAWPQLASLAGKPGLAEPVSRRALNASYLLGSAAAAKRLATIATDAQAAAPQRLEAIDSLAIWNQPFGRDRVTGLWRDLPKTRDAQAAVTAAAGIVPALLGDSDDQVRLAAAQLAGSLRIAAAEPALMTAIADAKAGGKVRAAALRALDAMKSPKLAQAVKLALDDKDATLVEAARQLAGTASPAMAVEVNAAVLGKGSIREQQEALATIAAQKVPEADRVLTAQLDLLLAGKLPAPLALDLLEAAATRPDAVLKQKLAAYETKRDAKDSLAKWRECLEGGDAREGRTIFAEKAEAGCNRCHKVKGDGGDVGPDLAGPTVKRDRDHLLQSILEPSALITPGYENVLVTLHNGDMIAGLLNAEDANEVTLASLADGKKQKIKKADIKERTSVPSAMPPGLGDILGKRGLRDVIEYLATVR